MSKVKIFFLASAVIGFFSLVGCSKSNNTTVQATVYYSPWLTISMTYNPTDSAYEGTIAASKLTQATLNTGAVLTYLGDPGYPSSGDTAVESAVDYGLYSTLVPGSIQLVAGLDFSTSTSGWIFRYVLVPGTVLATTGMTRQELQSKSYVEATKLIAAAAQKASTPTVQ